MFKRIQNLPLSTDYTCFLWGARQNRNSSMAGILQQAMG